MSEDGERYEVDQETGEVLEEPHDEPEMADRRLRVRLVSYRRTINLGDYESVQLEESVIVRAEGLETVEQAIALEQAAWDKVRGDVREQATAILEWRRKRRENALRVQLANLPRHVKAAALDLVRDWIDEFADVPETEDVRRALGADVAQEASND